MKTALNLDNLAKQHDLLQKSSGVCQNKVTPISLLLKGRVTEHNCEMENCKKKKKKNRVVRFLEVLHNNSDDRNVVERIAKRLVSWAKTITLYVRFTFSYISLPSCSKQELDMTRLRFWGERDRPTFYNLYELE